MIQITKIDDKIFQSKVKHAMEHVANEAVWDAQTRTPFVTGELAMSITKKKRGTKEYDVGSYGTDYAEHVEYGTFEMVEAHGFHDPKNPVTTWKALKKRGEVGAGYTLPFLRPFAYNEKLQKKTFKAGYV